MLHQLVVRRTAMFDIDRFAADCRAALAERGSEAIRDVVRRAVSDPAALIAALNITVPTPPSWSARLTLPS